MAQATIEIDLADVVEGKTDDRGRLHLGPEHADAQVEVVVLDEKPEREPQPAD